MATAAPPAQTDPRDSGPGNRPAVEASEVAIQRLRAVEKDVFETVTALQAENEGLRMQLADRADNEAAMIDLQKENDDLREVIDDRNANLARMLAIVRSLVTPARRATAYPLTTDGRRAQAVLDDGSVFVQQLNRDLEWTWTAAEPIPGTQAALMQEAERIVASLTEEVAS